MIQEPKFKLGQTVYFIYTTTNTRHVKCKVCDFTGTVKIKDGFYDCPNCRGGRRTEYKTYSVYNDKIRTQNIKLGFDELGECIKTSYELERVCGYYSESNLFATEAEAKESKKRMKK